MPHDFDGFIETHDIITSQYLNDLIDEIVEYRENRNISTEIPHVVKETFITAENDTISSLNDASTTLPYTFDFIDLEARQGNIIFRDFINSVALLRNDLNSNLGCNSGCTRQCAGSCGTGCGSGCGSSCGSACSSNCGSACSSTCAFTCGGSSCARGCYGGCGSGCTGTCGSTKCEGNCSVTCNIACSGKCGDACTVACFKVCWELCSFICSTFCGYSCNWWCSAGCKGSCDQECTGNCRFSCGTSTCTSGCRGGCRGGCSGGCSSGCGYGCKSNCSGNCATGCSSGCGTGCEGGCTSGCDTSCRATCDDTCVNNCTGNCENTSQFNREQLRAQINYCSNCSSTCQETCLDTCFDSCQDSCFNGCEGTCSDACLDSCLTTCLDTCDSTCMAQCRSDCETTCIDTCTDTCSGTCLDGCFTGCSGECGEDCTNGCKISCSETCIVNCLNTCSTQESFDAGYPPIGPWPPENNYINLNYVSHTYENSNLNIVFEPIIGKNIQNTVLKYTFTDNDTFKDPEYQITNNSEGYGVALFTYTDSASIYPVGEPDLNRWQDYSTNFTDIINKVIFSNASYVGATSNGIISSTDGITWQKLYDENANFKDITSSSNDLIACAISLNQNRIYYRQNNNWVVSYSEEINNNELNSIAYGNNLCVAVGNNGIIKYSSDMVTWQDGNTPYETDNLIYVEYGNESFVMITDTGKIAMSTNGIDWMMIENLTTVSTIFNDLEFINSNFYAVDGNEILQSSEGRVWSSYKIPTESTIKSIYYGSSTFIIITESEVYSTIDFNSYNLLTLVSTDIKDLTYGRGKFVAVRNSDGITSVVNSTGDIPRYILIQVECNTLNYDELYQNPVDYYRSDYYMFDLTNPEAAPSKIFPEFEVEHSVSHVVATTSYSIRVDSQSSFPESTTFNYSLKLGENEETGELTHRPILGYWNTSGILTISEELPYTITVTGNAEGYTSRSVVITG